MRTTVACGISGLPLYEDDEVGFVLLGPGRGPSPVEVFGSSAPRARVASADELYLPYLPPVTGKIGIDGTFVELFESTTVGFIASLFRRPAIDIINSVGVNVGFYDPMNPLRSLYLEESLCAAIDRHETAGELSLEDFGFELSGEAEANDEYTSYSFHSWGLHVYVDKEDLNETIDWVVDNEHLELSESGTAFTLADLLSAFSRISRHFPGVERSEESAVAVLTQLTGMYFMASVQRKVASVVHPDLAREFFAIQERVMSELTGLKNRLSIGFFEKRAKLAPLFTYSCFSTLSNARQQMALLEFQGTLQLAEMGYMVEVMRLSNKALQPSFHGDAVLENDNEGIRAVFFAMGEALEKRYPIDGDEEE